MMYDSTYYENINKEDLTQQIRIPYKDKNGIDYSPRILSVKVSPELDLCVFEISPNSVGFMANHWFLDETYIENDVSSYFNSSNVVFIHGFPSEDTEINQESKIATMKTRPYATFVDRYEKYPDIIYLHADAEVITETVFHYLCYTE